ncbi:MAG: type 11 methyltransferase [Comamonadaceae bacterium]|nr:MAG: type 11 methyltransferase [Comamonadaceae bacterium]
MSPSPHCPDRQMALEQYRRRASVYDSELLAFEPIRLRAIDRLKLTPGAVVMDVGCGTGLSFAPLLQAVGRGGHIIGIEQCPEMLNQACARVAQQGWPNVTLQNTPAEVSSTPTQADAALFHFTHDILRNPQAVDNVVHGLKRGAHVVAAGLQWSQPWDWVTNWCVMLSAMYSVSSMEGLDQPWAYLAKYLDALEVSTEPMGGIYIASGVVAGVDRLV